MKKYNFINVLFSYVFFMLSLYTLVFVFSYDYVIDYVVSIGSFPKGLVTFAFFVFSLTLLFLFVILDLYFINKYYKNRCVK